MSHATTTLLELFESWNNGDLDRVAELVTPDVEFLPLRAEVNGTVYRGIEGIRRVAEEAEGEYEYLRVLPQRVHETGDHALLLARFDARGRASGMALQWPVAWIARFREGRVSYLRGYSSVEAAWEALGLPR